MEKSEKDHIFEILEETLTKHHFRVLDGDEGSVIVTSLVTGEDYEIVVAKYDD